MARADPLPPGLSATAIPAPGLPFADAGEARAALRRSMLDDRFGAGGLPAAPPPPRPAALRWLRVALRRAARGDYGPAPGAWPGALDEAAAALAWLGPLRGPLLRALARADGAAPGAAVGAALAGAGALGPLRLVEAAHGDGAPPLIVVAPDAAVPRALTATAGAVVLPAGSVAEEDAAHHCYDLGSEAAVEQGDRDFIVAEDWSRALVAMIGADRPYLEPARRVLKQTAARRIWIARSIVEAARRSGCAGRIVLVAGKDDWRPLAHDLLGAGLGGAGLAVTLTTGVLESRLAFVRHAAMLAGAGGGARGGDATPAPPAALVTPRSVLMDSATLVVGDLRNPAEPRRAPTLRALLARLGEEGPGAALLEPWSGRAPAASIARRLRRLGLRRIGAAAFLRRDLPHPAEAVATRPALERLGEEIAAHPGAGGFLLEAARKLASEWPSARAAGGAIEAWTRGGPDRRCFLVQGGARFDASICAEACRRAGALSIDVQTTISSASPRYDAPMADLVACIDSFQRDLMRDHFGLPEARLRIVGVHEIDMLRGETRAAGRGGAAADAPTLVFYPAQGLPHLDGAAIRLLAAADLAAEGLRLAVSPHPSMGARQQAALEAAVGFPIPWSRGESLRRVLAPDVLAVATLFSNVAFRAGLLGKPVIVLNLLGAAYPVRFDALGLAERADDTAGLRAALRRLRAGGGGHGANGRAAAYRALNPQFAEGSAIARIAALGAAPR